LRAPFEADQRQGARQTAPYFFGSTLPPMDALLFPGRLLPLAEGFKFILVLFYLNLVLPDFVVKILF